MSSQGEEPERARRQDKVQAGVQSRDSESRLRRYLPGIIFIVVVAGLLLLVWRLFFYRTATPENIVMLSGRIEGDESAVAAKTSGRIREIRVREGDMVNAGDTLVLLDDEQIRAREDQARAAVSDAEARARAARQQVSVLREQLRQTQLQAEQARVDAVGRVRQAGSVLT